MHHNSQEMLINSKKKLEGELYELRELNSKDICDINNIKYEVD
jgi:hypothetical protein